MPFGHESVHLPVEKRQQQRANVRAVHIGVSHDHNLVVPPFAKIGFIANARANRRDHAAHFLVGQHLIFATLIRVDDLAPQRQDRLILAAATALGTATSRVAFH